MGIDAQMQVETSRINLETAKLAHKRMVEQLSMRTATIAQMAAALITSDGWPSGWKAKEAVTVATEIMVEAENSAAKEWELQEKLKSR